VRAANRTRPWMCMYEEPGTGARIVKEMAATQREVEINLSSKEMILGVTGMNHPLADVSRFGECCGAFDGCMMGRFADPESTNEYGCVAVETYERFQVWRVKENGETELGKCVLSPGKKFVGQITR